MKMEDSSFCYDRVFFSCTTGFVLNPFNQSISSLSSGSVSSWKQACFWFFFSISKIGGSRKECHFCTPNCPFEYCSKTTTWNVPRCEADSSRSSYNDILSNMSEKCNFKSARSSKGTSHIISSVICFAVALPVSSRWVPWRETYYYYWICHTICCDSNNRFYCFPRQCTPCLSPL